jgi:hypothetical protein
VATTTDLLGAFRSHLVGLGVVRLPGAGPDGVKPPMFVETPDGAIAPGEARTPEEDDATLILSIFWGGGIAALDDSFRLRGTIDVRFRSKTSAGLQRASSTCRLIRASMFEPGPSPSIRRQGWTMGGQAMILTGEWRAFTRLAASREDGHDHVWSAYVEAYA